MIVRRPDTWARSKGVSPKGRRGVVVMFVVLMVSFCFVLKSLTDIVSVCVRVFVCVLTDMWFGVYEKFFLVKDILRSQDRSSSSSVGSDFTADQI